MAIDIAVKLAIQNLSYLVCFISKKIANLLFLRLAKSMKLSIRPWENAFTVVSLLLFSQGFYSLILGKSIGGDEGDIDSALLRFLFIFIYLITFSLLAFRWARTLAFLKRNLWLLFLIGLTIFSISWSPIPDIVFRKNVALIGSSSFALYIASRYSFEEQLELYGWSFGIGMFCSLLFAVVIPAYGIMPSGYWRGIYPHKNGLGESMVITFLTFYFLANSKRKYKFAYRICCLLSAVIVLFSQSATSLISIVLLFSIAQVLQLLSFRSKKMVLAILLILILIALLIFSVVINFNTILNVYDRDITLTGRTPLWESLWVFIQQKPWLGYGYGTFFSSLHRETNVIWQVHDWVPPHAHNGFIGIWLDIGIVGLVVFSINYFGCIFNSLYRYLFLKDNQLLWNFLLLFYTIFFNLTEVSFLGQGKLWILSLTAIYSLKKTSKTKSLN